MEELGCIWFLTLTLLAAVPAAQTVVTDFAIGGSLVLTPPKPVKKNIVWKHDGDLVVEFTTGVPYYYGSFRVRSNLNTITGRLEIKNMTKEDEGVYTVEIEHQVLDISYIAKIPNQVPTPEVVIKPLSCSFLEENCTLSCEGDTTGAGQVTYSWKMGEEWEKGEKNIDFFKTKVGHIKTITCRMENVLGLKDSKPLKNPFIPEEKDHTRDIVGGVIGSILILGLIAGAGYWKREWFKQKLCANSPSTGENEGKSSGNSDEAVQLKLGNNSN